MIKHINGGVCAATGFTAGGIHCGIRRNHSKKDLALIVSDVDCAAAAVFTKNVVKAAPLHVSKAHLADGKARAIVVNSGNANACAPLGHENAIKMCEAAAAATADIPILGTSVTEYGVAMGIENFSGTVGGNVSGTSDLAPLDKQAQMILDWAPNAQKVGLLYCSAEANSTYQVNQVKAYLEAKGITEGTVGIVNVNAATDSTVQREAGFREAFEGKAYTLLETQYGEGDAAKSQTIAENYITQGVVGIFGCNEGSTNGAGNAVKAAGSATIVVGFDKSDAIMGLIEDGFILATMAQNPDVMGYEGVKAAVAALNGEALGGAVTDTGVSVLTK